jgi:scyllo-inositol 2-dehydrogenase (NADP+)
LQELVAHELDLVVVASANLAHAEQAATALKAGIPVVVDKPMGRNYAETKTIVDLSQSLGVAVSTFFNRRWDSDALTIKQVIASGALGQIFTEWIHVLSDLDLM